MARTHAADILMGVQGCYYFLTGVWPLVSIRTFKMVTGEKTDNLPTGRDADHWLVMTVGVLITAVAITMLLSAWRKHVTVELRTLAIAAAVGLTAIDVIYVTRGVILPVYLIDAVLEVGFIAGWAVLGTLERRQLR